MRTGIIRFPGSNCDLDTLNYFENSFFIWHTQNEYPDDMEFLVLPGGFAFGDRVYDKATNEYKISPGTKALDSPVIEVINEAVKRKTPILGICNGFQILTKMGLLPGKLVLNENKTFTCKEVSCTVNAESIINYQTNLYIANSYGCYHIDSRGLKQLEENNQIFLKYSKKVPEVGSVNNIAGVCNVDRTIFGMMPHPERNQNNFTPILKSIIFKHENQKYKIREKFTELMESEHISYKSTKKYLKTLHTEEDWVVQGPGENAGIIDIGEGYCLAARIESHNHPTFIDPFEGAATGVGGILRDIFTMGARPIAILDFLRFGKDKYSDELLDKAMKGISYYGNCFGVANIGGDCYLHHSYDKNPIVNVACIGIMKKEHIVYGHVNRQEQILIYVGSKTGYEGVGGAAMASKTFQRDQNTEEMKSTIQKSDPYLEKLLVEACLEISENKLAVGMQDMGAGGLLCATYEVISRGREKTSQDLGCKVFLNKVPIKYEMDPCDILVSESQERMLIVADKENEENIFSIFQKWDLEYATIGQVTLDGHYSLYNTDHIYTEPFTKRKNICQNWRFKRDDTIIVPPLLYDVSKKRLQYDSTIGSRTIHVGKNYSMIDLHEVDRTLILSWGENIISCHEVLMKLKAKPLAVINCLNYGHPETEIFKLSVDIDFLNHYCKLNNVPVIGGNVSLYNTTDNVSIRPTPIFLLMGLLI